MVEPRSVKEIFGEAVELPAGDRAAFLDRACGADRALRAQVEALLAVHRGAGEFLAAPTQAGGKAPATPPRGTGPEPGRAEPDGATTVGTLPGERAGAVIGRYRLLEPIGEGGFGVVFMAEQREPVVRKVALKIIKLGMDTRQVIARFEAERQALAMMDHPNIAKVFDAGATETGRPYFVMELVKGEPITVYCDKNNLTIAERLGVFAQVCAAVQHAHQKGIIHRDLKPGNILVSTQDGRPHAKVVDFGIAKATDRPLTAKTLFTEHRQLIGTPEYMSPEQADGSLDIDTRSDVYALGVLLYELLTGATPFDARRLRSAAYAEIQRIIREEEPRKPSTRLSGMRDTIGSVAAQRHTDPARLARLMRGDLDWIVMKALEKDRARRYETANGLAMDVRRHLQGDPVVAAPPSAAYRFRKLVRRHSRVFAAGACVVVGLGVFAAYAAVQAERYADLAGVERRSRVLADEARAAATTAEGQARRERDEAQRAQRAEAEQREIAERESRRARKVTDFLTQTLGMADPDVALRADVSMKAALDGAASRVAELFEDDPDSEARVRTAIGRAYGALGEPEPAVEHLERALTIREGLNRNDPSKLLEVLEPYMNALSESNDTLPERGWTKGLPVMRSVVMSAHPPLAEAMASLTAAGPNVAARHAEVMRIAGTELAPDDRSWLVLAQFLSMLADDLDDGGRHALACDLLRDARAIQERLLPPTDSRLASTLSRLARSLIADGQPDDAAEAATTVLERLVKVLPSEHWRVALARARLAATARDPGRFTDAERILLESRARVIAARGPVSVHAREVIEYSINLYEAWGRPFDAALQRVELIRALQGPDSASLQGQRAVFGPEHLALYDAMDGLWGARSPEAMGASVANLLSLRRQLIPDDHPLGAIVAEQIHLWVRMHSKRARFDEHTLALLVDAEHLARASTVIGPRKRASVFWWRGKDHLERGDLPGAESILRESLAIMEAHPEQCNIVLPLGRWLLGDCFHRQGRPLEAEPLLVAAFAELYKSVGLSSENTQNALASLLHLYRDQGRPKEALRHWYATTRSAFPAWAWDPWDLTRFILEDIDPELPALMERLRDGCVDDAASVAELVAQVDAARHRLFGNDDPVAMLYISYPWKWSERSIHAGVPAWVWEPFFRDVLNVFRAQKGPEFDTASNTLRALADCALSRGDYAEAEKCASEALTLVRRRVPEEHQSVAYVKCTRGAALLGQGRFDEAEDELVPAYERVVRALGNSHGYSTHVLGRVVDLYAATQRPARATEILQPVLRDIGKSSRRHIELVRYAWILARRPGLEPALYGEALALAEAACEPDPDDADALTLVGAAQYRVGRDADAAATLTRAIGLGGRFPVQQNAFLAMALHRLGQTAPARETMATLQGLMQDRFNAIDRENQLLVAEASALVNPADTVSPPGPTR